MRTLNTTLAFLLTALAAGACNHTPVANLEKSFTFKVTKDTGDADPIKIDFLWVVDNSSSMCQEQVALTTNFNTFVDQIKNAFDIDPHIAVTTVDAQCDVNNTTIFSSKGKFNTKAAKAFPPPCQINTRVECLSDTECEGLDCELYGSCGQQGEWTCRTQSETCVTNPNGSINTTCRRRCTTDDECKAVFGDDKFVCQKPSANQADWGCLRPPDSVACPDTLPEFLTSENIDLFPCIATVGVNQEKCLKFEQQIRSGYMALDRNSTQPEIAEQARRFLRDDAYLVVIFVSDEEDCSIADNATVGEDFYETCGLLKTTDEGGPLVPVAHYVNKFKALKTDPGRVIVAAIAGDSLQDGEAARDLDREAYVESKNDPRVCFHQSYICNSENGTADWGSRLNELTDGFGPNGSFANICRDQGIELALEQIAKTIVAVVNKVCLPRPVLDGLRVMRTRNDVTTELTEGDGPGNYQIVQGAEDCVVDGQLLPAVAFFDPPIPGEAIEIVYQGDPQFE